MATNQPPPSYGFTDQPSGPPPMGPPPFGAPAGGQGEGNGLAVAGLVLGILALVFGWFPILGWILCILGIIFGALGMSRANKIGGKGKGFGVAGLVCAIIGIVIAIAVTILSFAGSRRARFGAVEGYEAPPQIAIHTSDR